MRKGRPRATDHGGKGLDPPRFVPDAPVFHPTEAEFLHPLAFIAKIRPLAEPFGICRIVPPPSWSPPSPLHPPSFSFPTKTQPIHSLQSRPSSFDPATFNLDYSRFLESHRKRKTLCRAPAYDGEDLDLCRLFHAVKRFGGHAKVCRDKRWGDVSRILRPGRLVSECSKHVLSQLYLDHLLDYEHHHLSNSRPTAPDPKRIKNSTQVLPVTVPDQICEQCKSGLHGEVMLLCDRCDKGWHLHCLSPPLEAVPPGNWYCLECLNSDEDSFGFVPSKKYTIEGFRRIDDRAKRKWLGQSRTGRVQIEKRFWEIVEGRAGELEVKYGNDLDTSVYGSGFPRAGDPVPMGIDPDVWREYASSPWNINNLPRSEGSLLRAVHDNIAGVMVPWLYVGMLFSSFCWHIEDHCLYSINYLHWGEPKCWYGVPGSEATAFEKVMRNTLPDLFDAQPDLLFQLVTMLSPSVLQENGVPVYGVLQEPGNFVITFPKSFHAGFNFGLNCAEAVNFASADWLPHGGFGAELYRQYRKPAVLSHEELLCVVAKNTCDTKVFPYLKEEMDRIFIREKRCREELWRIGTIRSSMMSLKKCPMFVGHEEDPTCIICQQYLYLSAIACSCRPSSFVCLEHRKHLCECSPYKQRLLYRHSLAELGDLVNMCSLSEATCSVEVPQGKISRPHYSFQNESNCMVKKVKGGNMTYSELSKAWLSNACHILDIPFSIGAYTSALKEAEQFLWADHDMDPVRDMAKKLTEAQKWAMDVKSTLSEMNDRFCRQDRHIEKLSFCKIEELLNYDPLPCYEPDHAQLKAFGEDARVLVLEIESALSSRLCISELKKLYSRVIDFPASLKETGVLATEISSAEVLMNKAIKCLSEEKSGVIDIDFLNKLKSEMLEVRVRLPEMNAILDMCKEVESCQLQCRKLLAGPIKLKELEGFLRATDEITVSIPELGLLKQYLCDAHSWVSHLHDRLDNLKTQKDHAVIVAELSCILKAGEFLRVQVDELPFIEVELKKAHCREKASKALAFQMPLDLIQKLLSEATLFGIQNEKLFIELSAVFTEAASWEERANFLLEHTARMSEFDDVVRTSENILAILPSLLTVKNAIATAKSWMVRSQPYLMLSTHQGDVSGPFLKVDDLKELVTESNLLKVNLDGLPERLKNILKDVERWEHSTRFLLEQSKHLLCAHDADLRIGNQFAMNIEEILKSINTATELGQSMGFQFNELVELKQSSTTLDWCLKALSFCLRLPFRKEVDDFLEELNYLPAIFSSSNLVQELARGASWLRKACIIFPEPQISKRCKFQEAKVVLEEIQEIIVPYHLMVSRLQNAIEKHEFWIGKVHDFFNFHGSQSWSTLIQLKEQGQAYAFDCPEVHKVAFEIEKVEKWMLQCHTILEPLVGDLGFLKFELEKIRGTMERALCIFRASRGYRTSTNSVCCPNDAETDQVYTCLTCEDRYHFSCMGPPLATAGMTNEYACPFCLCIESGAVCRIGGHELIFRGKRPELKSFTELVSISEDFYSGIEEREAVKDIVKQALECRTYLEEIVDQALSFSDKDLSSISESLLCALKAIAVAGVYDHQDGCNLQTALCRNSWKIRVKKLLSASKKQTIQQVQRLLKEGLAIGISSEDHFMQEILKVKQISLQWADIAKKVALDSGEYELSEVFKLINEGESLPVQLDKEMKLLKERSVLYCVCRKPYDQKDMIACDQCDEWYHFECINLEEPPPKTFFCPACKPLDGEFISLPRPIYNMERPSTDGEPHTPPALYHEPKIRISRKVRSSVQQKMHGDVDLSRILSSYSEIDQLWRVNRRPLQRMARRRSKFDTQIFHF